MGEEGDWMGGASCYAPTNYFGSRRVPNQLGGQVFAMIMVGRT